MESGRFYTITITFGALSLAAVFIGGLLAAYWDILSTEATLKQNLVACQTQLEMTKEEMRNIHQENKDFSNEMRSALNKISDGVSDLRVQEAQRVKK